MYPGRPLTKSPKCTVRPMTFNDSKELASRKTTTTCHPREGGDLTMGRSVVHEEIPSFAGMTVGWVVASIAFAQQGLERFYPSINHWTTLSKLLLESKLHRFRFNKFRTTSAERSRFESWPCMRIQ